MRTLIIDTDIGVDDAFAMAYTARTQRLLGITTVFGNVAVGQAVKNARLFCEKMAIEVEVYAGVPDRWRSCRVRPPRCMAKMDWAMRLTTCSAIRHPMRGAVHYR